MLRTSSSSLLQRRAGVLVACALLSTMPLLLAPTALAQTYYYRSVMPDGRIVVGDKPEPGAKESQRLPLQPANPVRSIAPSPTAPSPAAGAPAASNTEDEVRKAQADLDAAKAALESGREPLPGERLGTVGGKSRLTDDYFDRIKRLEGTVAAAQKRLDQARRGASR
jgi:hypothetical protein